MGFKRRDFTPLAFLHSAVFAMDSLISIFILTNISKLDIMILSPRITRRF